MGRALLLVGLNISGPYRVGRYGMHLSSLEQVGVEALRRANRQPEVSAVVIDEIGKMELILGWLQQDQGEGPREWGEEYTAKVWRSCGAMMLVSVG